MRRTAVVAAVVALVTMASGCSLREVQLWFAINKKQDITRDQARTIADAINAKRAPGGCDANYSGCVPDNATQVRCAATAGEGPEVRGPLTVKGWDSFELDADGDKNACVDPAGNLETFGQQLDQVVANGWAFDPNTTDPISLDISDGGTTTRVTGDIARPDVNVAYTGVGPNHGFGYAAPADPGEARTLCVTGVNVATGANASLGCKLVTMVGLGEASNGDQLTGLIEGADRLPDGSVHLRGFALQTGPSTLTVAGNVGTHITLEGRQTVLRPDVDDFFTLTGAKGFDFVATEAQIPATAAWVCIEFAGLGGSGAGSSGNLSCRAINS